MNANPIRVLVLGAGFGGLTFCQSFDHPRAEITLIDRQNHHLFQPLLYQVATAGLAAPDIAQPIRSILSEHPRLTVRMDEVTSIELNRKVVKLRAEELAYDYLVIALGGVTSYFGHPEWETFAPGLKTLSDAVRIRREILLAFERAETENDPVVRERLMTIVVVGGGPTGVELAGAFVELARHVLVHDFRRIDPRQARVILIEGGQRVLGAFPPDLSMSAEAQLTAMGVDIRKGRRVVRIEQGHVTLDDGEIFAENIIWAAGVAANPMTQSLGVPLDRAGRIKVNPDLSLPGHPEVFAIGDIISVIDPDGQVVPGVSPAAMQAARHVASILDEALRADAGHPPTRPAFDYWDKGSMATIGRSAAVAKIGTWHFSGLLAWLSWLFIHLVFLVGFRNKLTVLFNWAYSYLTYKRGSRIITTQPPCKPTASS